VANRLARESSPYLLLHKDNPVDWYPWGEEAFARARAEDKPIFLSVGYSTCYWCHVMERESFSQPDVARQLNEGFVCVKVDREERPDVDEIYMTATQLITRSGGWPNSVFLTPDLEPFFAGTYFPPTDGMGRPGFPRVLQGMREAWLFKRPELLQQAGLVARAMGQHLAPALGQARALPGPEVATAVREGLAARFDPEWGGFGPAPKFPSPANLFFLLERASDEEARGMLVTTLDRMARGGLMDQLAGGFHRYSTDEAWLVPHFAKMLYDNASLAWLYAEASALAPGAGFDRVARCTAAGLRLSAATSPRSPETGSFPRCRAQRQGPFGPVPVGALGVGASAFSVSAVVLCRGCDRSGTCSSVNGASAYTMARSPFTRREIPSATVSLSGAPYDTRR